MPATDTDYHLLDVPEDPPRLNSGYQRRLSLLLSGSVTCAQDPRDGAPSFETERELNFLIENGLVRVLPADEVTKAAAAAAANFRTPDGEVRGRFRNLLARLGDLRIEATPDTKNPNQQVSQIALLGHEYLPASEWFPAGEFTFTRSFTPAAAIGAMRSGGPEKVFDVVADALHERVTAQLAVLLNLTEAASADLVCTNQCAPLLKVVENAYLVDRPAPTFVGEGPYLLTSAILRHVLAMEDFESLPLEQVAELAAKCKAVRSDFFLKIRHYADEVVAADNPSRAAERIARKHLLPELQAFDQRFGSHFRVIKSYISNAIDMKTVFTTVPLAAVGAAQGLNTAWALGISAAYSAAKTTHERRRWPRILVELRNRGKQMG